jgi:uncharacterized protein YneF (UPF0154 family)
METVMVVAVVIAVFLVVSIVVGVVFAPRKIADDVMLQAFGDAPHIEGDR